MSAPMPRTTPVLKSTVVHPETRAWRPPAAQSCPPQLAAQTTVSQQHHLSLKVMVTGRQIFPALAGYLRQEALTMRMAPADIPRRVRMVAVPLYKPLKGQWDRIRFQLKIELALMLRKKRRSWQRSSKSISGRRSAPMRPCVLLTSADCQHRTYRVVI